MAIYSNKEKSYLDHLQADDRNQNLVTSYAYRDEQSTVH